MKAVLVLVVAMAALAAASDVLDLDPSNFDDHVGGDVPALVEFFAPWCGHCKSLAPEYEVLGTTAKGHAVKIAKVDADKHRELGGKYDVQGFPTIKWFPAGSKTAETYQGGRSVADFVDFINRKAGTNIRIKSAPSAVVALTDSTFDEIVKDPTKDVLVEFYAPWCGHCKQLAPKYDQVGLTFEGEDSVVIAKVDADKYRDVGSAYGVSGYPTIKFFPKDNKAGEDYTGGRDVSDFVTFINNKAGTERIAGGGYAESAGRVASLDALVSKFKSSADRSAVLEEAKAAIAGLGDHKNKEFAKFYEITMKRIIEKGDGFARDEHQRLKRMLEAGGVAKNKRAEFYKRANVVAQFL